MSDSEWANDNKTSEWMSDSEWTSEQLIRDERESDSERVNN